MEIRTATIKDLDDLAVLFIEGYNYHKEGRKDIFLDKDEIKLKDELQKELEKEDVHILMLIDNNKVLGYMNYEIKKRSNLWINEIIITKDYRGRGYSRLLIDKAFEVAREKGLKRVELDCWSFNQNAIDMYKYLGFNEQRVTLEKEV